ncbi:MAG: hypothetical protein Q9174_003843 [Haloplaca sp. 1 TL-2023]
MLFFSSVVRGCGLAAMLGTPALAQKIAFGNPAFAGITFGQPFSVQWFGGNGSPVSIDLLTGNPASPQTVGTLATGLTASPFVWTPVASSTVRSGQLYYLSIHQGSDTNYSPMFGIITAAAKAQDNAEVGALLPVGRQHHFAIDKRNNEQPTGVHGSDNPCHTTSSSFFTVYHGHTYSTSPALAFSLRVDPPSCGPRWDCDYSVVSNEDYTTPETVATDAACPAMYTGSGFAPSTNYYYPTATGAGTGTGMGTGARGQYAQSTSPPIDNAADGLDLGWSLVMGLMASACVLLMV